MPRPSTASSGASPSSTRRARSSTAATPIACSCPASNTKIVVSAVAAALFAPDFTVRTSVYGSGPVVNGTLQGDLVLYGRGDPTFSERCYAIDTTGRRRLRHEIPCTKLAELAAQLARAGITSVAGDVVGDGSWFEPHDRASGLGELRRQLVVRRPGERARLQRQQHRHRVLPQRHRRAAGEAGHSRPTSVTSPSRTAPAPCRAARRRRIDFFRDAGHPRPSGPRAPSRPAAARAPSHFALPDPNLFAARAPCAPRSPRPASRSRAPRAPPPTRRRYEVVRRGPPSPT